MSQQELTKLRIIDLAISSSITVKRASELLNLSERQVYRQKKEYVESNFTHFQGLIEEHEGISASYPTVYRTLSQAGMTSPKKKRKNKPAY